MLKWIQLNKYKFNFSHVFYIRKKLGIDDEKQIDYKKLIDNAYREQRNLDIPINSKVPNML